jgi:hypothetical protein
MIIDKCDGGAFDDIYMGRDKGLEEVRVNLHVAPLTTCGYPHTHVTLLYHMCTAHTQCVYTHDRRRPHVLTHDHI